MATRPIGTRAVTSRALVRNAGEDDPLRVLVLTLASLAVVVVDVVVMLQRLESDRLHFPGGVVRKRPDLVPGRQRAVLDFVVVGHGRAVEGLQMSILAVNQNEVPLVVGGGSLRDDV